jgi:hypothetical protein
MRFSSNSAAAWVDSYWTFRKYANPDRTRPSKIRLNIQAVCWTSSVFRWRREDSIRPMSSRSMRWFIVVDGAKKRKDLARPRTQPAAGADAKFLRIDGDAAQGIMELAPRKGLQTHMKDGVRVAEEVHW